jgi:hypothetical protein
MTDAAARRFVNNGDKYGVTFNLSGDHPNDLREKRNNVLNFLSGTLTNIETLMKSDQFDP